MANDGRPGWIDELLERMDGLLAGLEAREDPARYFLATYRRTTVAVKEELERGGFAGPGPGGAVGRRLRRPVPGRPGAAGAGGDAAWAVGGGLEAGGEGRPRLPPLRHTLRGMNAHINYDLPQALLGSITDDEFDDDALVASRAADHAHIDSMLVTRVGPEDLELKAVEQPGDRTTLDRLLTPFNRAGTKRFRRESRRKTWHNARQLSAARRRGPEALATRLKELEDLPSRRVADLKVPGQVLLKLALKGFGVQLPG